MSTSYYTTTRAPQKLSALEADTEALAARELDWRTNDGIDVTLLWHPQTYRVSVAVEDHRAGNSFELEVDSADALDAFHHPYAYAATDRRPAYAA
jgi:hypothetical protein